MDNYLSILEMKQKEDGYLLVSTSYNDILGIKMRIKEKLNEYKEKKSSLKVKLEDKLIEYSENKISLKITSKKIEFIEKLDIDVEYYYLTLHFS